MFALLLALLCSLNFAAAAPGSRQTYIAAQKELVKTLVAWEKNGVWKMGVNDPSKLQGWHQNLSRFFLTEAIADDPKNCFFGGWLSQRRSANGSCMPPWSVRQFAQSQGATTYGPSCGGTQFRCNPGMFGPGLCVATTVGYTAVTASCADASSEKSRREGKTHWLESLSDAEFETWKETTFAPLSAQARSFCQQNPEMYRDNTCVRLLETLAAADQQSQTRSNRVTSGDVDRRELVAADDATSAGTVNVESTPVVRTGGTLGGIGGGSNSGGEARVVGTSVTATIVAPQFAAPVAAPIATAVVPAPPRIAPASPPRLFFNSIVGGSRDDEFLNDGIILARGAARSLGARPGSFLFGGSKRDGQCRTTYDGTINVNGSAQPIDQFKRNFMSQASCQHAEDISLYMLGEGGRAANCRVDPAVTGQATTEGFNSLWRDAASYQSGDVFYLHVSDHGGDPSLCQDGGPYCVSLSDGSSVNSKQLIERIQVLARRGVNVQLSVDACFSGGFAQEMNAMRSQLQANGEQLSGKFCATTSQDTALPGYSSDPLLTAGYSESYFPALQRYGNQLSASACAAGADMINDPTSSLEEFVRGWLRERRAEPTRINQLAGQCGGFGFPALVSGELESTVSSVQASVVRLKAEALLNDFQQLWAKPLNECWQTRQQELAFTEKVNSCMDTVTNLSADILENVKGALGRATRGAENDMADLQSFTAFFKHPSLQDSDLERFKDDFCCLARNLRTGELPASCRSAQ